MSPRPLLLLAFCCGTDPQVHCGPRWPWRDTSVLTSSQVHRDRYLNQFKSHRDQRPLIYSLFFCLKIVPHESTIMYAQHQHVCGDHTSIWGFVAASGFSTSGSVLTVNSCCVLKPFSSCDCGRDCGEWLLTRITESSVLNFLQQTTVINDKISVLNTGKQQRFSAFRLKSGKLKSGFCICCLSAVKYCTVYYMWQLLSAGGNRESV